MPRIFIRRFGELPHGSIYAGFSKSMWARMATRGVAGYPNAVMAACDVCQRT